MDQNNVIQRNYNKSCSKVNIRDKTKVQIVPKRNKS